MIRLNFLKQTKTKAYYNACFIFLEKNFKVYACVCNYIYTHIYTCTYNYIQIFHNFNTRRSLIYYHTDQSPNSTCEERAAKDFISLERI